MNDNITNHTSLTRYDCWVEKEQKLIILVDELCE